MMMLSEHFSYEEAMVSKIGERVGIDNHPPMTMYPTLLNTAVHMEKVRTLLGKPIHINSWYRSPRLNDRIGGAIRSQHMKGEAVDFICPQYGSPAMIVKLVSDNNLVIPYDQIICEHAWVHISFSFNGHPRGEVLSLLRNGGYIQGITDKDGNKIL